MSSFRQWLADLIYYFAYFPLVIQIAILVSVFAVAGTLIAYIYMMLYRWRKERRSQKEQPVRELGDALLLEHIVYKSVNTPGEPVALPLAAFQELPLSTAWGRDIFVNQLLEYRMNFTGDIPDLLRQLYLELGLHQQMAAALKSGRRKAVIAALVELAGMGVLLEKDYILTLTRSKDKYIREMARCYMVQCSPDAPFEFLEQVQEPLLPWEQFELFRIISLRKDIPVPDFARWIDPAFHPSVVSLCLKLATYYQQPAAIPAIIRLLDTPDESLRAAAINSLGKLMAIEAEPLLIDRYPQEPVAGKLEILKALGRIGSGQYLDFLQQELEHTDEPLLMKHAAHSIVAHHALAGGLINRLQHSLTGSRQLVLQHSLNPLIKY
ncbi:HEAT repeat domain-containing protein [Chitinophaga nivalis]|uniref:HEAT repeat domain-containing protein n=1 Tax=Chitinophaga nivalis TaxID=2991709 RepID=A0ABT3IQ90_9BACT|nr:HEAT repeat domain-containing protein [Chitinophaga nivalis]MCW3464185.1 HEAT repeat domain-containing protein [Chitinophaga nivalis]MCW3486125.1 HEAT repeat domain-containing protein [Chitinophaga nivalis]